MVLTNFQSFDNIELNLSGKSGIIKNNAFIYGENGSGKSNIINSLVLLLISAGRIRKMEGSTQEMMPGMMDEEPMNVEARRLHMIGSDENMSMTFEFRIDGGDNTYSMSFDKKGILVSERLDCKVNKRKGRLFEINNAGLFYMSRGLIKDKRVREKIRGDVRQYWGQRSFIRIMQDEIRKSNIDYMTGVLNANLFRFHKYLDGICVKSMSYQIGDSNAVFLPNGKIKVAHEKKLDAIERVLSKFFSRLYTDVVDAYFDKKVEDDVLEYELFFKKRIAGVVRDIPVKMESTGTKRMMDNLQYILACVGGSCVFVDEIDIGVHDLLISGVLEQAIPDIGGQLIATTHNTSLMESLAAESVYIIGVDRNGFKKIYTAASKGVRSTNNTRHKYLVGDLDGVPYISDLGLPGLYSMINGEE